MRGEVRHLGTPEASRYGVRSEARVREAGRPAPSGLPTVKEKRRHCAGNEGSCRGFPARGTDFCIGHLRSRGEA